MRLLVTLIAFTSFLFSQQDNEINNELVQNLIQVSGVEEQIQDLPSSILPSLNQALEFVEAEAFGEQRQSEIEDSVFQMTIEEYRSNLSEAEMLLVIDWYQTPLGKKIVKIENLEDEMYTPDDTLRATNLTAAQKNAIDAFVESFGLDTLFYLIADEFTPITMKGVVRKNLALQNKTNEEIELFLSSENFSQMIVSAKARMLEGIKANKLKSYMQYSKLNPSEFAAYAEFNATEYGAKFLKTTINLLGNMLQSLISETRVRFRAGVEKQKEVEKS